ncbi:MAG: DciA family protein [Rhizomicrobium sp.]|jgi:hypothetical protein
MMQDESDKLRPPEAPRRNRTEPVERGVNAIATSAFERAGFRDSTLIVRWAEIVGPEVARYARPLRLSEGPSGGVLTLKSEPGASLFLQHESRALCERINAYLGRVAIVRLRFVQGEIAVRQTPSPLPKSAAEAPATDPARGFQGPERLKEALINLARVRQRPRNPRAD